ncbi:hypothetical protein [Streptomyces sp. 8N706]
MDTGEQRIGLEILSRALTMDSTIGEYADLGRGEYGPGARAAM